MESETNQEAEIVGETNRFIVKVYAWMFTGLLMSGAIAYYTFIEPLGKRRRG